MELPLKQERFEHFAAVFEGAETRELAAEPVLPDTLPDAESVADVHGVVWLRGKEITAGGVSLSAAVGVSVLCVPADGGPLRCVELELPAELRLDAPGADEDCRCTASVRLCALEARVLDPRKLSVRAEVCASVRVRRRESVSFAAGLAEGEERAHIKCRTADVMPVTDMRERAFAVTDEFAVPAGLGSGVRILSRRVTLLADDVKVSRGKAVLRGRAVSELVFGDDGGAVRSGRYETELSQLMEVDAASDEALCTVTPMLTGAFFDLPAYGDGAGRVAAELHFTAQCECRERRRVPYLADVYSNRTALTPALREDEADAEVRPVSLRQTVAGRAEPAAAGETVCVSACVGPAVIADGAVRTTVLLRTALRAADGSVTAARCRLSAEFTPGELPEGTRLAEASVTVLDVYAAGADVRAVLRMDALAVTGTRIRSVASVTEDPEAFAARPRTPSAVLVRVPAGTELWELARRFGSSEEAIAAANGGRADGLLLIPKCK